VRKVDTDMKWGKASSLVNPELKLIIFGGKGGSGKTTSAAATALYLNKAYPDRRLLVMSVDPAHSLADSFSTVLDGNKVTPIAENMWCLEIEAQELLAQYKARYGDVMKEIVDRVTYFDKQDIGSFFDLSLPGLDEVMAITRIADLLKGDKYDLIILDTAPTGHTKILLSLPQRMAQWVDVMNMLMEKHRYIVRAMTGRYKKDKCDTFIENQRKDLRRVRALLTSARTTEFVPVTTPQPMSIFEVEKLTQALLKEGVPIKNVIVNQVIEERECPFCASRGQRQQGYLQDLEQKFASFNLVKVSSFPYEIRGQQRLMEYGRILFEGGSYSAPVQAMAPGVVGIEAVEKPVQALLKDGVLVDEEGLSRLSLQGRSFIIFGGKGGVGKTVIAAASALHLATVKPQQKVLVFSTDPAHSLSDVFEQHIANKITKIGEVDNLYALEIDGNKLLENFKRELKDDIEEAFDKFLGGGVDIKFDREILQELLSVSPPGLDELMALKEILDLRKEKEYDLFVLDSAASGHLLRFLELPQLVRDWLKTTFSLLLKYKGLGTMRFHNATERLLDLSRRLREIMNVLSDPQRTEFVMITIPEAMAIAEAVDLASSLKNLSVPSSNLILNMVMPPTDCAFCARKREEQIGYLEESKTGFPNHNIVHLPLFTQPTRGIEGLSKLADNLYGNKEAMSLREAR